MENLEQIIARQEKTFQDLKLNDTWYCGGNQDNVEILKEETWNWHRSSIKEILEGVVQIEKLRMIKFELDERKWQDHQDIGFNQAKSDTINYLEEIIKKL